MQISLKKVLVLLFALIVAIVVIIIVTNKKINNNLNTVSKEKSEKIGNEQIENKQTDNYEIDEKINYQTLEDNTKINNSSEFNKDIEYNGLKLTNIQFTENNGVTVLLADVENISGKDISDFTDIDISFYNENNKRIGATEGLIIPLKANEKTQLNTSLSFNYVNAYTLKITEHKSK